MAARDNLGDSGSASVTFPYSPTVATLSSIVQALVAAPHPLQVKLDAAARAIADGRSDAARGLLGAFRNQVAALVRSGRLSAAVAAVLDADAAWSLASL